MVATSDPFTDTEMHDTSHAYDRAHRPAKGGFRRLLLSSVRVADLQYRIWLTRAKMTLMRMALYATLFAGAMLLGILAVIFLYIGTFKLLTDVAGLRPVWAYLIFGGFHAIVAAVLVMIGTSMLNKKDDPDHPSHKNGNDQQRKTAHDHEK